MAITRQQLIDFYSQTQYDQFTKGLPPRPREGHLPIHIYQSLSKEDINKVFSNFITGKIITEELTNDDLLNMRTTLLHESFFSFFKGYYNYLAAKRLYAGGLKHWIEITSYYSQLYLAKSLITLAGKQKYAIRSDRSFFIPEIFQIVNPNQYQKFLNKYGTANIDYETEKVSYSITLNVSFDSSPSTLIFDNTSVDSHRYVWEEYSKLDIDGLGMTNFLSPEIGFNHFDIIDFRNRENYSFEGYMQLDFNLSPQSFPQYFERDHIKDEAALLYDDKAGIVLEVIQQLYHLYQELKIIGNPVQIEKLKFMAEYTLDDSPAKYKLLDLCDQNLPLKNKYYKEAMEYFNR